MGPNFAGKGISCEALHNNLKLTALPLLLHLISLALVSSPTHCNVATTSMKLQDPKKGPNETQFCRKGDLM